MSNSVDQDGTAVAGSTLSVSQHTLVTHPRSPVGNQRPSSIGHKILTHFRLSKLSPHYILEESNCNLRMSGFVVLIFLEKNG